MEGLLDWGADVVRALEGWRPTFDWFFQGLTRLGEVEFFFLLLAALYWLVDRDLAIRIAILLAASTLLNAWLKDIFNQPRPFAHDPTLLPLIEPDSLGFPSGHAQSAVVIWGSILIAVRSQWVRLASAAALALVPFSRLYLGVHFPHDLVGGYFVGAVLLWTGVKFLPAAIDRFFSLPFRVQLVMATALPVAGTLPLLNPSGVRAGAAFAGGFVGLVIERRWIGIGPVSGWFGRVRRLLVGSAGVAALWWFAFGDLGVVVNSFGLVAVALWIAAGAPWVFQRIERHPGRHAVSDTTT